MRIIGILKKKLNREEKIDIDLKRADNILDKRRSREIKKAEKKADELIEKTDSIVDDLEQQIESIKNYQDEDGINTVEDVAENFYQSRKRLIQNSDFSRDISNHRKDLESFLTQFNDVTRKEGAVMHRIEKNSLELPNTLTSLEEHLEEISEFEKNRYQIVDAREKIREKIKTIEKIEGDIEQLNEEISNIDKEKVEKDRTEVLENIKGLKNSDAWIEKNEIKEEIKALKEEKKQERKKLSETVSMLGRGLKKLIYNIENQGLEYEGNIDRLKLLRDGKVSQLNKVNPELKEALDIIKEEEILGDKQYQNFKEATEKLSCFKEDKKKIENLKKKIESKEKKLENLEVDDKLDELEREKNSLNQRLDEMEERKRNQKERIRELQSQLDEEKQEIKNLLSRNIRPKVNIVE